MFQGDNPDDDSLIAYNQLVLKVDTYQRNGSGTFVFNIYFSNATYIRYCHLRI